MEFDTDRSHKTPLDVAHWCGVLYPAIAVTYQQDESCSWYRRRYKAFKSKGWLPQRLPCQKEDQDIHQDGWLPEDQVYIESTPRRYFPIIPTQMVTPGVERFKSIRQLDNKQAAVCMVISSIRDPRGLREGVNLCRHVGLWMTQLIAAPDDVATMVAGRRKAHSSWSWATDLNRQDRDGDFMDDGPKTDWRSVKGWVYKELVGALADALLVTSEAILVLLFWFTWLVHVVDQ